MRSVVRNSFARHSIQSERVYVNGTDTTCTECGSVRQLQRRPSMRAYPPLAYLLRFHIDDDQGPRTSGPIANGKLFCSRGCAESYIGVPFDEVDRRGR